MPRFASLRFASLRSAQLLDKYVGESERAVRQVFERARASSPCIIFFDELDSLCPRRGGGDGGSGVSERVVNQLLTEMDGLDDRKSIFVIAATNRPELIDPAILRPGRLDKLLYVPLPDPIDRVGILKAVSKKANISEMCDLHEVGMSDKCNGYSGADMAALLREAGLACLKARKELEESGEIGLMGEVGTPKLCIEREHFESAFENVLPSVTQDSEKEYNEIRQRISGARSRS